MTKLITHSTSETQTKKQLLKNKVENRKENITHSKCWVMDIIQKDCVKITEKSMLWCIIAAITKIKTSNKSSYLSLISRSLCIDQYTFLMMSK